MPAQIADAVALTASQLEEILEEHLDPVLSSRRTASPIAQKLALLPASQQAFILRWVEIVARTGTEMAYQVAAASPEAFKYLDERGVEEWIIHAMDVYDKEGLYPASNVLKDIAVFAQNAAAKVSGVTFDDVSNVLELFLCGLSGRRLKLEASSETYTDSERLYLPHRLALFADKAKNFSAYKASAAHLWAQTRYGTFRVPISETLAQYDDPARALLLFHYLERVRLDARIKQSLPGLFREMTALETGKPRDAEFQAVQAELSKPMAQAADSLATVARVYPFLSVELPCYLGSLYPDRVAAVMHARIEKERELFRVSMGELLGQRAPASQDDEIAEPPKVSVEKVPNPEAPDGFTFQLQLDDVPIAPPADVENLLESIVQDLGEIPPEYLVAAGAGSYKPNAKEEKKPEDVWKGIYHEEGAFLYNEWDYKRQHYRKNWCVLREMDVHPQSADFVRDTARKYAGYVAQLKRTFEALRGEDRLLKKQKNGDDVDIDAVVDAYADMRCGQELPDRLFTKLHKQDRNIAVMFMVDMSGSTKGWINDAEREALVMLCEALEILGDRYAIYGFSGISRKRCEIYRIKRFDEPYDELVKQRVAGITPQDYTRMGVAIRHLSHWLNEIDARTKLLITLSDGKPDDYNDMYRGEYGIEDTRRALLEAKRNGIHPFCVTLDKEGQDYLPHMYGAVNYTVIDDVRKLPLKVAEIYRRLTT